MNATLIEKLDHLNRTHRREALKQYVAIIFDRTRAEREVETLAKLLRELGKKPSDVESDARTVAMLRMHRARTGDGPEASKLEQKTRAELESYRAMYEAKVAEMKTKLVELQTAHAEASGDLEAIAEAGKQFTALANKAPDLVQAMADAGL